MLTLFQPLLTALVGAALSIFGLFHTIQQLPAPVVWHHVVSASPQLMALLILSLAALLVVLLIVRQRLWPAGLSKSSRITLAQIQAAAELVTLKLPMSQIVEVQLDGYSGGVRCVVLAHGEALIATDLDRAALELNVTGRVATVTLPPPRAISCRLDHEATTVALIGRRGAWRVLPGDAGEPAVIERALREAQRRLEVAAGTDVHLDAARCHAEAALRRLIEADGWTLAVRWQP